MKNKIKPQNQLFSNGLSFVAMIKGIKIKYTFLFVCLLFMCGGVSGQCDSIVLSNQSEVNNFIKNYGYCTTIKDLVIEDKAKDITSLDSLYTIERITGRLLFNEFKSSSEINISGFQELRYLDHIWRTPYVELSGQFSNLDTINVLQRFGLYENEYIICPKIKHIGRELHISRSAKEEEIPNFTTGNNFRLLLDGEEIDSQTLKTLSRRIKTTNLRNLSLFLNGVDLSSLTILDSVKYLRLGPCTKCNLAQLSTIRNLKELTMQGTFGNNDFGPGFIHVRELNTLWISDGRGSPNIPKFKDYKKILPNLEAINMHLLVSFTDSLFNLDFLDDVRPPLASTPYNRYYGNDLIFLVDNLRLKLCKSLFLCRAVKQYPDRIYLGKNSGVCTVSDLTQYCNTITVNTEEESNEGLRLLPNPTSGILQISASDEPVHIRIWNIQGVLVKTIRNCHYEVDITDMPQGMYIIETEYKGTRDKHKIVKVD